MTLVTLSVLAYRSDLPNRAQHARADLVILVTVSDLLQIILGFLVPSPMMSTESCTTIFVVIDHTTVIVANLLVIAHSNRLWVV